MKYIKKGLSRFGIALALMLSFNSLASGATVSADVTATSPIDTVSDSDSVSSILMLISTRDLSVATGGATAEADATIITLFYSHAYASGKATGPGTRFSSTAETYYHGKRQDYKQAWGGNSLNIVFPEVILDYSETGLASFEFSFFETGDPLNVFFSGSAKYSGLGLIVDGEFSLGDFIIRPGGEAVLVNTTKVIDDSLIPSNVDLTFENIWHAEGEGHGSASASVPEPSTITLLLFGVVVLFQNRKNRGKPVFPFA